MHAIVEDRTGHVLKMMMRTRSMRMSAPIVTVEPATTRVRVFVLVVQK
jgi:hypothetical protein